MVYVPEMARYQIAEQLAHNDNGCKHVQREYDKLARKSFSGARFTKNTLARFI